MDWETAAAFLSPMRQLRAAVHGVVGCADDVMNAAEASEGS